MRVRAALLAAALVIGGVAAVAPPASAAGTSYTWTGDGDDTSWTDAGNWTPNGVPGNGDSVHVQPYTVNLCATHVTAVPTGVTLADLTLSEDPPADGTDSDTCAASLADGSLSVSGSFTWNGGELDMPLDLLPGSTGVIEPGARQNSATDRLSSVLTVEGDLTLSNNAYGDSVDKSVVLLDAGVDETTGALTNGFDITSTGTMTTERTNDFEALACCTNPTRVVNHGTIDNSGSLRFDDVDLDQDGTLTDGSGAETDLYAGIDGSDPYVEPNTGSDGAIWNGPGAVRVTNASAELDLSGTQQLAGGAHLVLGGQGPGANPPDGDENVDGTFTLTGDGEFDWLGGHLTGRPTIDVTTTHIGTTGTPGSGGDPDTQAENTYVSDTSAGKPSTVAIDSTTTFAPGLSADVPETIELGGANTLVLKGRTTVPSWVQFYDGHVDNSGALTFDGAAGTSDFMVGGDTGYFVNTGTVTARSGTFVVDNPYRQTAGTTTIASGARISTPDSSDVAVSLAGGTLAGVGTVTGGLSNSAGTVSPGGTSTGMLTVSGAYTQGSNGREVLQVRASRRDVVAVGGPLSLKGRIVVQNGFTPRASSRATVDTARRGSTTLALTCTGTTGPGVTGKKARHWVAQRDGRDVVVVSRDGVPPHC